MQTVGKSRDGGNLAEFLPMDLRSAVHKPFCRDFVGSGQIVCTFWSTGDGGAPCDRQRISVLYGSRADSGHPYDGHNAGLSDTQLGRKQDGRDPACFSAFGGDGLSFRRSGTANVLTAADADFRGLASDGLADSGCVRPLGGARCGGDR